jgi:hypothetical protein
MDILKINAELKAKLTEARELAIELRDHLHTDAAVDLTGIDMAIETVNLRQVYHENQAKAKAAAPKAKAPAAAETTETTS